MREVIQRRKFLLLSGAAFCGSSVAAEIPAPKTAANPSATAYEELMSEHSILRRALYMYLRVADLLDEGAHTIPTQALGGAASLFRRYGEDFHEAVLEEKRVFVDVRKFAPEVREMPDVLVAQHRVGRTITDHIFDTVARRRVSPPHAPALAALLRRFVWMYQNHAAREDTVLFPAWKRMLGDEYADASREFDALAREFFGDDGFRDAEQTLSALEHELGLENLAAFTAAPPQH